VTLRIATLADRPELSDAIVELGGSWPEFMTHDIVSDAYWGQLRVVFREFALVGTYRGEVVARGFSVPFGLRVEGRGELPADGWDRVLIWAFADHRRGLAPDAVSAIEILVDPAYQGRGFSGLMLAAMRDTVRRLGFSNWSRRSGRMPSTTSRGPRCASTRSAPVTTGCRLIRGFAPMSGPAARS
jgi:GNAT superfamily N-acetyltransferase